MTRLFFFFFLFLLFFFFLSLFLLLLLLLFFFMRLRNDAYLRLRPFTIPSTAPCHRPVHIVSPTPSPLAAPLLTFGLPPNVTSPWFAEQMLSRGFVVKASGNMTGDGGPDFPVYAVRLSFHLFNDL